ncbi:MULTISPECIES: DUF7282 domain-containing protein [Thalassobaculum]|uniref:DUF7282 domain-containing protein n=1 Tax=Thalassobaculum litoreum DSM 18839 TaxID=1123362 RepID=A0A8G2BI18_9PROT|nr:MULTISPECIES: hypothetical protein [Thalassobaculum]SDF73761.1 hypothetical protein SAMN05660686_02130 [Thalassobaculum litoreum DSM 18839]
MTVKCAKHTLIASVLLTGLTLGAAQAMDHAGVKASGQSVAEGSVTAMEVMAPENGWLVVHRTGADHKPGPVVGYAPLKKGENAHVTALLSEPVKSGEMLMLMVHSEAGGTKTGIFEYTLGAKEDGPIKPDGKLVMTVITAE